MANSYQTHSLTTASTGPFSFAQIDGYLSVSHLSVLVNGAAVSPASYTINETTKTVTFTSAIGAGSTVRILRTTPKTVAGRYVNFENASVLTADDLDNAALQNLYIAQEAEDTGNGALPSSSSGTEWDARGKRIINVGDPTATTDAANKNYVDAAVLNVEIGAYTNPQAWEFTGDGTASYLWTANGQSLPTSQEAKTFIVEVGGVIQHPITNYSITPTAIVFTSNIGVGVTIRARNFGVAATVPQWDTAVSFTQPVTFGSTVTIGSQNKLQLDPLFTFSMGGDNIYSTPNTYGSLYIGTGGTTAVPPANNTEFKNNTGIGVSALQSITSGQSNTALGTGALTSLTTGIDNVAVGVQAGIGCTTGNRNVFIGKATDTTGHPASFNNTIIGHEAGWLNATTTQYNCIAIGSFAVSDGSDTTVIGNTQTTQTKLHGNLIATGTGTSKVGGALEVAGNITLKTGSSGTISSSLLPTGSILQIVSVQSAAGSVISNNSTSYASPSIQGTITPTKATSKIFVVINGPIGIMRNSGAAAMTAHARLSRNTNVVVTFDSCITAPAQAVTATSSTMAQQFCGIHLDSPATTSALTYTVDVAIAPPGAGNGHTVFFPYSANGQRATMHLIEIA